jgi:multidrug efflux pump subunit AcrA (membrane-fusion protein)
MKITGMNRKRILILAGVVALIAAAAVWLLVHRNNTPTFKTARAVRGEIMAAVTATGTVKPSPRCWWGRVSGSSGLYVGLQLAGEKGQFLPR